jgi:hypothetical protein
MSMNSAVSDDVNVNNFNDLSYDDKNITCNYIDEYEFAAKLKNDRRISFFLLISKVFRQNFLNLMK